MDYSGEKTKQDKLYFAIIVSVAITIILAYLIGYAVSLNNNVGNLLNSLMRVMDLTAEGQYLYSINASVITAWFFCLIIGAFIFWLLLVDNERNAHEKKGTEAGTAGFQKKKDKKKYDEKYVDKEIGESKEKNKKSIKRALTSEEVKQFYSPNMILANDVYRSMNDRKTMRNNNILIIGGAGTGKSRFFIKPNVLQFNASYVITDPSGEILISTGKTLQEHGYKIKIFNISDMQHSNCYNPLEYVRDAAGVGMVIDCFIKNTTGKGQKGDEFFTNAERLLYGACIFYLINNCSDHTKKNFPTVLDMVNSSAVDESNPNAKSPLDDLFDSLPHNELAWKYYKAFKQAAGKTLKSIIISCVTRLQPFMTPQVVNLTKTDDLELSKIGDEKTALFIITPQADRTYAFLASMLYSQLFETLYYKGEQQKAAGGSERMKYPVRCLMDEFANIGEVPEFPSKLSTMRKYNISTTVVIQDKSQLETMYKDEWRTITGNCDSLIFLGSSEPDTLKYLSERLGTRTITKEGTGRSSGKGGGNKSYSQEKREVMTPEELGRMDNSDCVVFTRGERPILAKKFKYETHPMFDETSDGKYGEERAFLYNTMSIFDNTKMPNIENLLMGINEAARAEAENLSTDPYLLSEAKTNVDVNTYMNNITIPEEEAVKSRGKIIRECITEAGQQEGPLSIIHLGDVQTKEMKKISSQVGRMIGKPVLLTCENEGSTYVEIICFKYSGLPYEEWDVDYTLKFEENGEFLEISIRNEDFEDYMEVILSSLHMNNDKEQTKEESEKLKDDAQSVETQGDQITEPGIDDTTPSVEDYEEGEPSELNFVGIELSDMI